MLSISEMQLSVLEDAAQTAERTALAAALADEFPAAHAMIGTPLQDFIADAGREADQLGFSTFEQRHRLLRLRFVLADRAIPELLSAALLKVVNSVDCDADARLYFIETHLLPRLT